MEFVCPECGPQERLLFDASYILEREFEGVWFDVLKVQTSRQEGKITVGIGDLDSGETAVVSCDGTFQVRCQKKNREYLEDFNVEKHLSSAVALIEDGGQGLYCPKCEEPIE